MTRKVAVLMEYFHPYHTTILAGIRSQLDQEGMVCTAVIGRFLNAPSANFRQANQVYGLVQPEEYDGLIVFAMSMGVHCTDGDLQEFVHRFRPMPTVCLGRTVEGAPSVLIDNRSGMEALLDHLVLNRGFRSFVFVRGIRGLLDSDVREGIFREKMQQYGLDVPEHHYLTGNFAFHDTQVALEQLLKITRDFDVVVCANDEMAQAAIDTLSRNGLIVPDQVAVTGFDDSEEFQHVVPALTTVRQSFFEQGRQAVRTLMKVMQGPQDETVVHVPCELVIRESCGNSAIQGQDLVAGKTFSPVNGPELQQRALEQLHLSLQENRASSFLKFWRKMLLGRPQLDEEFMFWQHLLGQTFQHMEMNRDRETLVKLSDLKEESHHILSSALQMLHSRRRVRSIAVSMSIPTLFKAPTWTDLLFEIHRHLTDLDIQKFLLVLRTPQGHAQVALYEGFDEPLDAAPFVPSMLLPPSMQSLLEQDHLVVTPLFDAEGFMGHLVYQPPSFLFFDEASLANTLSSALQQYRQQQMLKAYTENLEQQVQLRTRELQAEIQERRRAQEALQEANAELQRSAFLDGLTQIYNRTAFNDRLRQFWSAHTRNGKPLGLILCDVDFFKKYNDHYGHLQGDACLRAVAEVLATAVRKHDFPARYGGEEFAILLPETDLAGALRVAERVQQLLQQRHLPHLHSEVSAQVTLSMGVACVHPPQQEEVSSLVQQADLRLYQAKRSGRNRVAWEEQQNPSS
ncbi:diguanylate cyclase domain-containing protein [Deinococcus cellulosilyticus]|uniref:GGDEF domain-containing protein n=1 Tax=Deinococcus cellulosilyticus (strain DSM 18568 / NBRC 106333 / KACC 11606 / 5516J-15) TaxID=1223518 RepID=A0A511N4C6_DEIC1|nr:diguanylate cyclase [Deinococcus cellulosilyticus]GEM47276.1 hypothetical protein DC3_29110 [Deinococcus cellulosilyticus NBRC 106333 = KACC 11606]